MINREEIIKCLGHFSKRVDLDINELESINMGDYVRKLIEYHVEKCDEDIRIQNKEIIEKVQAYVLIPKKVNQKLPGIIAIHQHNSNWKIGKSEVVGITNNSMYSYGLDLVKQGYVVIAPDILCFESRLGNDEYGKDKEGQRFFERFEAFKLITEGSTLQAKTLNDLSATIDVLSSFEFVDSNRIGVIGHSLGGQEAIWLSWYDKRVKVTASSCGVSCIKDIFEKGISHNSWMYIPGLLNICDMDDIIRDIVKDRKLIMTNGLKDERHFPISGIKKIQNKVGDNNNFKSVIFDDEHLFRENEKEIVYKFINDNL